VTSPTFVLAREYRAGAGGIPLVHVDAYRLGDVRDPLGEIDALDLDATVDDAVTVVEWGSGLAEALSASRVEVRIDFDTDESLTSAQPGQAGEAGEVGRLVVLDVLGPATANG
jgi:tRNA threonylcarbamoyladenosine biosynthesis protein TsaE